MTLESKHMLARTFLTSSTLTASVTDSAGSRTVNAVASGVYYRAVLAETGWTGSTKSQPVELLRALQIALNAAIGSTHWLVYPHSSGRVCVRWIGTGNGTVSGDAIRALGFASGIGPIASGTTVTSDSSAQGVLVWSWLQNSTGFTPDQTSATSEDELGRTHTFLNATRWKCYGTAQWIPREFADNGSGEYLSPLVSQLFHLTGTATPTKQVPTAYKVTSWLDNIHTVSGSETFGYYDKAHLFSSSTSGSGVVCSDVALGSESFTPTAFTVNTLEPNLITRYEFKMHMNRIGAITL